MPTANKAEPTLCASEPAEPNQRYIAGARASQAHHYHRAYCVPSLVIPATYQTGKPILPQNAWRKVEFNTGATLDGEVLLLLGLCFRLVY
jgi:hypothetical protein